MIIFVPLQDLRLFVDAELEGLSEAEIVERIRREAPELFKAASVRVESGMVLFEFREAPTSVQAEARRLLEKGNQRCRQGDYRKAIGILERVLELDPSQADAYRNLGMAYVELGETEKAREYLVEAALLAPADPWPYVVLANHLLKTDGQLDTAEALLRKAHVLAPTDPWAMNSLGGIATERGDLAAARDWFGKALVAKPDFANARYGLANALASAGDFEAAQAELATLFTSTEFQDHRSERVFKTARGMWLDLTRRLALGRRESSLAAVRDYVERVARASGYPVRETWSEFPENFAAQTEMAWKKARDHHLVRLRSGFPEPEWHHILAHEATHIALEHEARSAGRNRWFVSTAEGREKAIKAMAPDLRKLARQGYAEDDIAQLMVKLLHGASAFVFNCPLDMVIEARLKAEQPELRLVQHLSLDKLAREAASVSTNPSVRGLTPPALMRVNDVLNAATALYLRRLTEGALDYVDVYRPFNCLKPAERIHALYLDAASHGLAPGDEYGLVDAFAGELGVRDWYTWRPDTVEPAQGQDTTAAEPGTRKIDAPAALMYLVAALERLEGLPAQSIQGIAAEAALVGHAGLDIDNPEKRYNLSVFPGERFSGLELLCLMYAAFQQTRPELDLGVDMSTYWPAAQTMFRSRQAR